MSTENSLDELQGRIHDEIVDSVDEELEMEIDDERLARVLNDVPDNPEQESLDRTLYFRELFRLQGELVKLQDWVVQKLKVVVLFEGRDAAGKGGVIKRITQRLNPRVCRVGRSVGAERAGAHPVVFPALRASSTGGRGDRAVRPQLVQPGRRRARDGLLHGDETEEFFRTVPEFEKMLVRSGIILIKYWFSITR